MLSLLDRGSTFDDWIEDLLLTIGSRIYCRLRVGVTFIHRPVRVFVRWSQFLWDRLRREPIIVVHLLCIFSDLLFYCLCDPRIKRIALTVLYDCTTFVVINKTKTQDSFNSGRGLNTMYITVPLPNHIYEYLSAPFQNCILAHCLPSLNTLHCAPQLW